MTEAPYTQCAVVGCDLPPLSGDVPACVKHFRQIDASVEADRIRRTCANCDQPIEAGERRVSWFATDAGGNVIERGAVHLVCPPAEPVQVLASAAPVVEAGVELIEYEGGEVLANLEDRTITGLLIPFDELGQTNAGRFVVDAQTFPSLPADPSVVGLNLDHQRDAGVGRAARIWQEARGIFASLQLARTPEGDAALADAINPNGRRRRLSAEFHVAIRAGRAVPGSGRLWGAALVPMGAFPSAMVLASDTPTTPATAPQPAAAGASTTTEGASMNPEQLAAALAAGQITQAQYDAALAAWNAAHPEQQVDAAEPPVVAPAAGAAPPAPAAVPVPVAASIAPIPGAAAAGAPAATATPRGESLETIFAAIASLRVNRHDTDARAVLAAIADIPMTGAGALPGARVLRENWLGKLYQGVTYQRQFIDLCNHGTDITAAGKQGFRAFRGTGLGGTNTPKNGAWAGFPNQINGYQGSTDVLGSFLLRFALGNAFDRAFTDLPGGAEVVQSFVELVVEDYMIWSDEMARQRIISQPIGGPVAAATAKYPANYPAALGQLIQGILAVKKKKADKRSDVPTFAIANDAAFEQLAYAAGGEQNLPAFVKVALSTDRVGEVDGDVVVVNGDTGIQATPSVVVGAKLGIDFDELAGGPLHIDALELTRGGIDEATHGYLQVFEKRPEAFVHIGTADAWAAATQTAPGALVKSGAGVLQAVSVATAAPMDFTAATGGALPALPGAVGGTVVDGSVTWKRVA